MVAKNIVLGSPGTHFMHMRIKEIHLKFPINACKNVLIFFFLFLFLVNNQLYKVARRCLSKQSLQICVLQIMQNNLSNPKPLMINHIIIWIIFGGLSCWPKYGFKWRLHKIEFLVMVCKFLFCKLCKIR